MGQRDGSGIPGRRIVHALAARGRLYGSRGDEKTYVCSGLRERDGAGEDSDSCARSADVSYLRMFSLKARLEARKKEIVSRTAKPAPGGAPHIVYVPRKKETSCTMMEGTIEEQARALHGLVREGRDG